MAYNRGDKMPDNHASDEATRHFREEWSRTRLKGRRRFALIFGVGIFGGVFASGYVLSQIYKGQLDIVIAAGVAIACAAGGYFVGLKTWDANEARFLTDNQPTTPPVQN